MEISRIIAIIKIKDIFTKDKAKEAFVVVVPPTEEVIEAANLTRLIEETSEGAVVEATNSPSTNTLMETQLLITEELHIMEPLIMLPLINSNTINPQISKISNQPKIRHKNSLNRLLNTHSSRLALRCTLLLHNFILKFNPKPIWHHPHR